MNGTVLRRFVWQICIVSLFLVVMGCQSNGGSQASERLEQGEIPYEEPIVMKIGYPYSNIILPEGDAGDENFVTRYIQNKLGIIIKYDWESTDGEQYKTMIDLAIKSNDLPDAFIVTREQLLTLLERDMIADLSDVFPQYATSLLRSIYDSTDGKALEEATFDGKLYALPNVYNEADAPTYLWVRQDWMDKLRLDPPSTLLDIEHIAKAFIEDDPDGNYADDTIGIPVTTNLIYEKTSGISGLNSVFASFRAFPKDWYRNEKGNVVYGSIQTEAKEALALLARWYREGIIDRDFMLRKDASFLSGQDKVGILFGPWWTPYWPLSTIISEDTKAEWSVFAAPKDANNQFVTRRAPFTDNYLVVRKDYSHPEAALKLLHLFTSLERYADEEDEEDEATASIRQTAQQMGNQLRNYFPLVLLLDDRDAVVKRHDLLVKALNKEIDVSELNPEMKKLYEYAMFEQEFPRKDIEAWSASQAFLQGGGILKEPMVKVEGMDFDPTPAYAKYWPELERLERDYYLKIIMGDLPITAFDRFVKEWMDNGGRIVMKEVTERIESQDK